MWWIAKPTTTLRRFGFKEFTELAPAQLEQVAPEPKVYASPDDFSIMSYSGSGDVTGTVQAVDLALPPTPDPSSTSGCEAADFTGFTPGNIALDSVERARSPSRPRTRRQPVRARS